MNERTPNIEHPTSNIGCGLALAIPARWSHHLNCLALDWTIAERMERLRRVMMETYQRMIRESEQPQAMLEFFTAAGQALQLKVLVRFYRGWRREFQKVEGRAW